MRAFDLHHRHDVAPFERVPRDERQRRASVHAQARHRLRDDVVGRDQLASVLAESIERTHGGIVVSIALAEEGDPAARIDEYGEPHINLARRFGRLRACPRGDWVRR